MGCCPKPRDFSWQSSFSGSSLQFSLLSKLVSNLPLCSCVFEINKKPLCCSLKVTL